MYIRKFSGIINQCARDNFLHDCDLVIDGQNFLYDCYKKSKLRYDLGAECDRYANYLKQYLNVFKKANVKCYFIFKGGTESLKEKIIRDRNNPTICEKKAFAPIFMNEIHLQVLEEMGFDYVFSEYFAKNDCIALAKHLSCPVLSYDTEYALYGVQYIPSMTLKFDDNRNIINCKLFEQKDLLQKFKINKDKLAMLVVLTDVKIFPENFFADFFNRLEMSTLPTYNRNKHLLRWLSKTSLLKVFHEISNSNVDMEQVFPELTKVKKLLDGEVNGSLAIDYILNRNNKEFTYKDDWWFKIGVAQTNIAKQYIDIYRSNVLLVSGYKDDDEAVKSIEFALNIIKYAYDLLTNFQNDGLYFVYSHWDTSYYELTVTDSVKIPSYEAKKNVFENGWDNIQSLQLFHHFMVEEVNFKFDKLEEVPANAKMLVIALVYFNTKKMCDTNKIAYSVLLCYIVLGALNKNIDNTNDVGSINVTDCKSLSESLKEYFSVNDDEISVIKQTIQPLFQFQQCLRHLNYLNKLCGSPFEPTIYSKTYNGSFISKILYCMQHVDESIFFSKILESAPSVLNFANNIIKSYKNLL